MRGRLRCLAALCALALAAPFSIGSTHASAAQDPTGASCAAQDVTLVNGSFESPVGADNSWSYAATVPGWSTDDVTGDFEIWRGTFLGVSATDGAQLLELDANSYNSIWQTVPTTPGQTLRWQLDHRARNGGSPSDTMTVSLGPSKAGAVLQSTVVDGASWVTHSGTYVVPPGQTSTTFVLTGVSSADGSNAGNLIDDLSLDSGPCVTVATTLTDDNGDWLQPADNVTVTSTVTNAGPSAAGVTSWHGPIPANTSFLAGSVVVNGVPQPALGSGAGVDMNLGSLLPGQVATISYQVTVDAGAAGGTTIDATPTASYEWTGITGTQSSTSDTPSLVVAWADVSVALTVDAGGSAGSAGGPVPAGQAVVFHATVTNLGPADAVDVVLTDQMPTDLTGATVVDADGGTCLALGRAVRCSWPILAPNTSKSVVIKALVSPTAADGSKVSNTAVVAASSTDLVLGNNTATASFGPVRVGADLGTGVVPAGPVVIGGSVSFHVSTGNVGPSDAHDVVVTTLLPDGINDAIGIADPSVPGGVCSTVGRVVTCTYPVLPAGRTVTTTVAGRVASDVAVGATFAPIASSRSATADPNSANDAAPPITTAGAQRRQLADTGARVGMAGWLGVTLLATGVALAALSRSRFRGQGRGRLP